MLATSAGNGVVDRPEKETDQSTGPVVDTSGNGAVTGSGEVEDGVVAVVDWRREMGYRRELRGVVLGRNARRREGLEKDEMGLLARERVRGMNGFILMVRVKVGSEL
jgi:hypothetical protein